MNNIAPRRLWLLALAAIALSAGVIAVITLRAFRIPAHMPTPLLLRLSDGTEVFHLSNCRVSPVSSYPQPRELTIDGEAFVRAAAASQPLVIRTRLMVLTATGNSALRVTAPWNETGEEADVLSGHVVARKAYRSYDNEPDILLAGDEVLVNETIDLQEKERTDLLSLRWWSEALIASVAQNHKAVR
jgi:hypothetical protein